jgi:hypothetical protein
MGTDRSLIAAEQAPFHKLIKMIERELELAGQGRGEELQAEVLKTGAYMDTLPHPAPESAMPLVLRAQALRARVTIETERLRESIAVRRTVLKRGRRMARKYAGHRGNRYTTSA